MHPPARARVNFRTVFTGRVRFGGMFRRSLKATTKKGRQLSRQEKVHPRQNPGYAYGSKSSTLAVVSSSSAAFSVLHRNRQFSLNTLQRFAVNLKTVKMIQKCRTTAS